MLKRQDPKLNLQKRFCEAALSSRTKVRCGILVLKSLLYILIWDLAFKCSKLNLQKRFFANLFHIKIIKNRLLSYFFIIFTFLPFSSKASNFNDIITSISSISCETLYLVEQSYYPNTCIPDPVLSQMIGSIISPGMYIWAMNRLAINKDDLFSGNCKRENRLDPYNPKITFGFCSNLLLVPLRALALVNVVGGLIGDVFTGKDPWNNIKNNWYINPKRYYQMPYVPGDPEPQSVGASGVFVDLNLSVLTDAINVNPNQMITSATSKIPVVVFPWEVIKRNDAVCVATISIFGSWLPIGCKYMVDPYVISQYYNFFHTMPPTMPSGNSDYPAVTLQDGGNNVGLSLTNSSGNASLVSCMQNSCYTNTMMNTKAMVPMAGPIVSCVQQMLTKVLISQDVCTFDQYSAITNKPSARARSTLYAFQDSMRNAVTGLLTLYIILVGFKILLGGEIPQKGELVRYLVKFILVVYFSIGITVQGTSSAFDGMSEWILPVVFGGAAELAGWVTSISPSGLCVFSPSEYDPGYGYLALWDALDCRIAHYLGIDQLADMTSRNAQGTPNFDALRATIPPWVFLLFPALYSGQMQLVMLVLSYPILVISVAAYMVYAFIVCLISITILSVLAPIFVPMVLFEYTKGYFESWVKLIISFVLQPMVVSTFMITIFSIYDFGFFGTCKFESLKITQAVDGTNTTRKLYALNNNMRDKTAYPNAAAVNGCVDTIGWIFNAPFSVVSGSMPGSSIATTITDQASSLYTSDLEPSTTSADDGTKVGTTSPTDQTYGNNAKHYGILSAVKTVQGVFFPITIIQGNLTSFMLSLFLACFCLYILKELSEQVAEFAADMTEGLVISPPKMSLPPATSSTQQGGKGSKDGASMGEGDQEGDYVSSDASGGSRDRISGVGRVESGGGESKDRITASNISNNLGSGSEQGRLSSLARADQAAGVKGAADLIKDSDLSPSAVDKSLVMRDSNVPPPSNLSQSVEKSRANNDVDLIRTEAFEKDIDVMKEAAKKDGDRGRDKAYRKLALKYHPDKNRGPGKSEDLALKQMSELNSEYGKLGGGSK